MVLVSRPIFPSIPPVALDVQPHGRLCWTHLVLCLTNTLTNLRVLLAVGCVRHSGLDPGSSSRGPRHQGGDRRSPLQVIAPCRQPKCPRIFITVFGDTTLPGCVKRPTSRCERPIRHSRPPPSFPRKRESRGGGGVLQRRFPTPPPLDSRFRGNDDFGGLCLAGMAF